MFNSLSLLFPGRIITVWPSDPHTPSSSEDEVNPLGECGDMYVPIPRSHHPVTTLTTLETSHQLQFLYAAGGTSATSFPHNRNNERSPRCSSRASGVCLGKSSLLLKSAG